MLLIKYKTKHLEKSMPVLFGLAAFALWFVSSTICDFARRKTGLCLRLLEKETKKFLKTELLTPTLLRKLLVGQSVHVYIYISRGGETWLIILVNFTWTVFNRKKKDDERTVTVSINEAINLWSVSSQLVTPLPYSVWVRRVPLCTFLPTHTSMHMHTPSMCPTDALMFLHHLLQWAQKTRAQQTWRDGEIFYFFKGRFSLTLCGCMSGWQIRKVLHEIP